MAALTTKDKASSCPMCTIFYYLIVYIRDWQASSVKNQIINILGFEGHVVYDTATQFHCHESYIDNMQMNECGMHK